MKVAKYKIAKIAKKLGVNSDVMSLDTLQTAVHIELEHGSINNKTNVTNNNLTKTLKIALAHIEEFPDYYDRLLKMEAAAKKYWKTKQKPSIWR